MAGDFFRSAVFAARGFARAAAPLGLDFAEAAADDLPEAPALVSALAAARELPAAAPARRVAAFFFVFAAGFVAVAVGFAGLLTAAFRAAGFFVAAFFARVLLRATVFASDFFAPAFCRAGRFAADLPFALLLADARVEPLDAALARGLVFSVGVAAMICLWFLTDLPVAPENF